jgi:hypothetical protein
MGLIKQLLVGNDHFLGFEFNDLIINKGTGGATIMCDAGTGSGATDNGTGTALQQANK